MKLLRQFMKLFRRETLEADMADEMRHHLEEQTQRNVRAGMPPAEAVDAAQRQFGNVASVQERARESCGWGWLEQSGKNLRFAFRALGRSPGYAATTVLTLALGIGASTAIFSVTHAILFSPLQYAGADRLVQVRARHQERGLAGLAPATFADLAPGNSAFATTAAQYYYYVNLTGTEMPTLLNSADVTAGYFELFGVPALHGRTWQPADLAPGSTPVVVLGHALWRSQFNGRTSLVGEHIMLDGVAHTVLGIMPPAFKDPAEVGQLWRPMRTGADNLADRNSHYWTTFGRLKPGVVLAQANAELETLGRRMALDHPREYEGWTLQADDLRRLVVGDHRTGLLALLGAVACVMLIASANVTGLSLVRASTRRREMAVRMALGSSPAQLVRLLLTENLVLALLGGGGGVLLAHWGTDALLASLPPGWLPRADEISLSLPVLFASLAITGLAGVIPGLVTGFSAARFDAQDGLKDGTRVAGSHRLRGALIVGELALALVLLAAAGLLARSFAGLMRTGPGVDAERILSLTVSLPAKQYDGPVRCWEFFSRAQTDVAALPGVEAAGFTHTSPFRWGIPVAWSPAPGAKAAARADVPAAFTDAVSVDYFRAMGIPLRAGRLFTAADDHRARPMVILSETAARQYFGREDPVGRFLSGGPDPTARFEVVGVVRDVRRAGLTAEPPLQVYRPMAQRTPPFATLMVRTSLPPATLAQAVQAALWRINPDIPLSEVAILDTFVRRSVAQPRLHLVLFGLFAGLSLLLAGIGLHGLVAYSVAQRTKEFGIRGALGASPGAVLALVLREGSLLVVQGLALGLVGALLAVRWLEKIIYSTSPYSWEVFLGVPLVLGLVALVSCLFPAWRAAKVDPMVALRAE